MWAFMFLNDCYIWGFCSYNVPGEYIPLRKPKTGKKKEKKKEKEKEKKKDHLM